MTAIITGDIINSSQFKPQEWLLLLKESLNNYGSKSKQWDIYRGDSFQMEMPIQDALEGAIHIKSTIKQVDGIDVRMSIGIGEKSYSAKKVTESNGSAFIRSGECFEQLKNHTLAINSPWKEFDSQINLMLELALLTMDSWTSISALIIKTSLENPDFNQKRLSEKLNKTQSTISEGLKRAGFEAINKMMLYYKNQIEAK